MTTDPVRRSAARTATIVAVPAAIAVAIGSLWSFDAFDNAAEPSATAPAAPQATSAVEMSAPDLPPDVAAICRAVVAKLPDGVREHRRRPVTAGAEQNAAYGDPPITLSCGTVQPDVAPTAQVNGLSGVCWYAEPTSAGTVWTTVDRRVPVTVTVPGPQDGSAQSVIPFADAIVAGDPAADNIPSGCNP